MKTLIVSGLLILTICILLLIGSCRKTTGSIPYKITPLSFIVPPGFPPTVYSFQSHPCTEEGFELGKKLFYDGRLSLDGNYPCSSCHQQVAAFTTYYHDRSHGYGFTHTLRNSPGLANLAWDPVFNQDGSGPSIESVALNHITSPTEMAESMDHVISKLKADTSYQRMFRNSFGDDAITTDRILNALTQFVINMVSLNSKYDQMLQGTYSFTAEEQTGYQLFKSKCTGCHAEPLLTDFSYRNVGLPVDPTLNDYGRMRVTHDKNDSIKFRVPALRNLNLTAYYAHDGRFSVFRMMLDHYRSGVIQSPTLDPLLTNGIAMTNSEQDALVTFLFTLSDSSYLSNPRFKQ